MSVAASFNQPRQPILSPEADRLRPRGVRRIRPPRDWLDERRTLVAASATASPEALSAEKKATKRKLSTSQRLIQRTTMGWSEFDQARLDEIGYNAWLGEQLEIEGLDDGPLEEVLADALPALSLTPAQLYERYENQRGQPIFQLIMASLYRAAYSPRQLFERTVIFWSDHFSIDLFSGVEYLLKPTDDRDVIRRHAMSTFPELLSASAHSPAMLTYLTNTSNVAGHPNENYARELMELHTMGADGPFTEQDVKEVARCFTGWGVTGGRFAGPDLGEFRFNPRNHDTGSKVVLGNTIPAGGGQQDGERVLEILSSHPATADFLATKMLRYFQGYEPKKSTVSRVASVYRNSGGDIRKMLKTILKRKRMRKATPKLKRPFHLMVSALRVLNADLRNSRALLEDLYGAGHLPFAWSPPNGYPDSRDYWVGFLLPRWNFAGNLPDSDSGIKIELSFLDASMTPEEIAGQIDEHLFNGKLSKASRIAIEEFAAAAGEINNKKLFDAVGVALSSPEFQDY
ncbi:MAG: DUF1800 domain-containing protein [Thermoanaerobaculia bacterium]